MVVLRVTSLLAVLLLFSACGREQVIGESSVEFETAVDDQPAPDGDEQVSSESPVDVGTAVDDQPAPDGDEDLDGSSQVTQAVMFREFFEGSSWRIVERSGFVTTPIDGRVRFDVLEGNPTVAFNTTPCPSEGLAAIEWNVNGFKIVVLSEDQLSVFLGTEGESCDDDLLGLLIFGLDDDQFDLEIAEDPETVLLQKGDQSLTLVRESSSPSAEAVEPPPSSTTTAAVTTTTVSE